MITPLGLAAAFILDLMVGDPEWTFHPIRLIGKLISRLETLLRRWCPDSRAEKRGGAVLALSVMVITYSTVWVLIRTAQGINGYLGFVTTSAFIYFSLSARSLGSAAGSVRRALLNSDEPSARTRLARIVGRDTGHLSREEIVRATVETVAENTSDGIVAPLFFLLLGGAPLAMAYKAVNTLDSMVGYRDDRYGNFGWASARCDDLANYLPARITGILLIAAALLLGKDWKNAMVTMVRDGRKHASVNSGYPEAAVAGALRVQLGGTNYYRGMAREAALLGHPGAPLDEGTIGSAVRLMYGASLIMVLFCLLFLEVAA